MEMERERERERERARERERERERERREGENKDGLNVCSERKIRKWNKSELILVRAFLFFLFFSNIIICDVDVEMLVLRCIHVDIKIMNNNTQMDWIGFD